MENRRYTPKHSDKTGSVKRTSEPARRTSSTSSASRPTTTPRKTGTYPTASATGTTRRPSAGRPAQSTTLPSRGVRTDSTRTSESVKKSAPVKREAPTPREQTERKGNGGKSRRKRVAAPLHRCILSVFSESRSVWLWF